MSPFTIFKMRRNIFILRKNRTLYHNRFGKGIILTSQSVHSISMCGGTLRTHCTEGAWAAARRAPEPPVRSSIYCENITWTTRRMLMADTYHFASDSRCESHYMQTDPDDFNSQLSHQGLVLVFLQRVCHRAPLPLCVFHYNIF